MERKTYAVSYIGSSESYTIYNSNDGNDVILQVNKFEGRVRYRLKGSLREKAKKGSSLIDEVRQIIRDDSEFLKRGDLERVVLPDSLFRDF